MGKPRVESDADEVVAAREGAEAVRERDVVLHLAILGRNDVGVLAHRVTAPAGQVRIGRGGDAIALVIGRCHRQIIGDAHLAAERAAERVAEVAAVVVVVATRNADALLQLVLGLGRDVPVVVPFAVAAED